MSITESVGKTNKQTRQDSEHLAARVRNPGEDVQIKGKMGVSEQSPAKIKTFLPGR